MKIIAEYTSDNVESTMYELDDGTYLATSTISIEIQGDRHEYYQSSPFVPNPKSHDRITLSPERYFKRNLIAIVLKHMDNIKNTTHDVYETINKDATYNFVNIDPEGV